MPNNRPLRLDLALKCKRRRLLSGHSKVAIKAYGAVAEVAAEAVAEVVLAAVAEVVAVAEDRIQDPPIRPMVLKVSQASTKEAGRRVDLRDLEVRVV